MQILKCTQYSWEAKKKSLPNLGPTVVQFVYVNILEIKHFAHMFTCNVAWCKRERKIWRIQKFPTP